jgi:hypothetical protein
VTCGLEDRCSVQLSYGRLLQLPSENTLFGLRFQERLEPAAKSPENEGVVNAVCVSPQARGDRSSRTVRAQVAFCFARIPPAGR